MAAIFALWSPAFGAATVVTAEFNMRQESPLTRPKKFESGGIPMNNLFAIAVFCLSIGCTSSYQPPAVHEVTDSATFAAPVEEVWQAVISYFAEENIPIENLDHSSYFIKTRPLDLTVTYAASTYAGKKIPLKNKWCDCGDARIANVWKSSQRVLFSFNIVLHEKPEGTTATINVFFDGMKLGQRSAYASGYDIEMPLQCVSSGLLEGELLQYLREFSNTRR
jgi:hypothetical protein